MAHKIGFIGLGTMGRWMARCLLRSGFDLAVFDIDPRAVAHLTALGAKAATGPQHLAEWADWVFLCLPGPQAVEEALFGNAGLAQAGRPGLAVVDCGTTSHLRTLEFAAGLSERGIRFADSPVSGMEERAKDGTLTIMFGGEESLFEEMRPALDAIGSEVIYMGSVGSGQLAKLTNQLLFNISAAAIAEVLPMAARLGLDPEKVLQVVSTGTGSSYAARFFGPRILEGRFGEGYPLQDAYKDMASAAEISAHERIPLPMVHAATTTYQMALAAGLGSEDKGAMIKVFEQILNVEFRRRGK